MRALEVLAIYVTPFLILGAPRDEKGDRGLSAPVSRHHAPHQTADSIDLVTVTASGILLMGFACAFAALLIR